MSSESTDTVVCFMRELVTVSLDIFAGLSVAIFVTGFTRAIILLVSFLMTFRAQ